MKIFVFKVLILWCNVLISQTQIHNNCFDKEKIRVLIVDGFSNHDWKQTSHIVNTIIGKSGLFDVSISTTPSEPNSKEWSTWNPKFKNFDVVIQNTNNIHNKEFRWPKRIEKRLERYMKAGGGLYILHSANNAFSKWQEYNLMIGLGWRSANEGVAIKIDNDQQIHEIPVGVGKKTYHGPRSDMIINILNNHPINKEFPKNWKTPNLELYKYARGPAKNLTVLSYAMDKDTGINWPVDWVVSYGKGRIYNSSFGHLWKGEIYPDSYKCIGYQTTLIRALEWLAKGKVTSIVPEKFPTKSKISIIHKF